jgi:hypothetical protein
MRRTLVAGIALMAWSCAPTGDQPHQRLYTEDFFIQVWMDPAPPRALEDVVFRVVVRDKETGEPIEGGEGRVFATNEDRKSINNGFTKAPELGTYTAKLMFVTAGSWAVSMQFRRDSTQGLQRVQDWMQEVYPERAPGEETATPKP